MPSFYRNRRLQQPQLPASVTTPIEEAYAQENDASQQVNQAAQEQDSVLQEQQDQKQKLEQAQQSAKINVARAKKQGIETEVNPDTGAEDVKRHEDGAPVWKAGFLGAPQPTEDGSHIVPYRDARGQTYGVPLDQIQRTADPTGQNFYEFNLPGPDGQPQTVRRPEEASKPLFKVDPLTGKRYSEIQDPETGSYTPQPLGIDTPAANKATIEQKKAAYQERKAALNYTTAELDAQRQVEEETFKPVQERYKAAKTAAKALTKGTRYETKADGLYAISKIGDQDTPFKIDPANAAEVAKAQAWLTQKKQTDEEFAKAKAEHDPLKAKIGNMQKQKYQIALQALQEGHNTQLELAAMQKAAKAGIPLYEPDWKKRLDAVQTDPNITRIHTQADHEGTGSPLAGEIGTASTQPETNIARQIMKDLADATQQKTLDGTGPLAEGTQPTEQVSLKNLILGGLTAGKPQPDAQDIKNAPAIVAKSLGINDADKWTAEASPRGDFNLRHASKPDEVLGTLDPTQNRVTMFRSAVVDENGRDMLRNVSDDGMPVYIQGAKAPLTKPELSDLITTGLDAAKAAPTNEAAEKALADLKLSPPAIRERMMNGEISVQDAKLLNRTIHGINETDTSKQGVQQAFADHLAKSQIDGAKFANGSVDDKIAVINHFSDGYFGQATGRVLLNRNEDMQRRAELLAPISKSAAASVWTQAKQSVVPSIAMLAQTARLPLDFLGVKTEAGDLAKEQWDNWLQRTGGYWNKVQKRDDVINGLNDFAQWAAHASPGDEPPADMAQAIAKMAYTTYHQLTPESAKDLNTTEDTFNPAKNPMLRGMLDRFLQTSDPQAWNQLAQTILLDQKDRDTMAKVANYVERPRAASADIVANRAKVMGLNLDPQRAAAALDLGHQLDNSKSQASTDAIIAQAGKLLGVSPKEAQYAIQLLTTQASDDPNSITALARSGWAAGYHEVATEVASSLLEAGIMAASGATATPEIAAERAARLGAKTGMRAAFRKAINAKLEAVAEDFPKLTAFRARLGAGIRAAEHDFEKMGIVEPKFGKPLTVGQKARNLAVGMTKAAAAAAPIEAIEEGASAVGEQDPTIAGTVEQMGQGALGAVFLTPLFAGAHAVSTVRANAVQNAQIAKNKQAAVEDLNTRLASAPGFKPITVADFDTWQGLLGSPAHKAAVDEYHASLAELADAQEAEAAAAPATPTEGASNGQEKGQGQEGLLATPAAGEQSPAAPTPPRLFTEEGIAQMTDEELLAHHQEVVRNVDAWKAQGPLGLQTAVKAAGARDNLENEIEKRGLTPTEAAPAVDELTPEESDRKDELLDKRYKGTATPEEIKELSPLERRANAAVNDSVNADLAQPTTSGRLLAAQTRVEQATQNLAGLSETSFAAMDELRQLPEGERALYTGAAKAVNGSNVFTADEAKALIRQDGANAVAFQQAEVLPPDVQGPRNLKSLAQLPTVTNVGGNSYRLPPNVKVAVPPALIAGLNERAPSLTSMIGNEASDQLIRAQAAPKANAQAQAQPQEGQPAPPAQPAVADTVTGLPETGPISTSQAVDALKKVVGDLDSKSVPVTVVEAFDDQKDNPTGSLRYYEGEKRIKVSARGLAAALVNLQPNERAGYMKFAFDEEIRHAFTHKNTTLAQREALWNDASDEWKERVITVYHSFAVAEADGDWKSVEANEKKKGLLGHELIRYVLQTKAHGSVTEQQWIETALRESKPSFRDKLKAIFESFVNWINEQLANDKSAWANELRNTVQTILDDIDQASKPKAEKQQQEAAPEAQQQQQQAEPEKPKRKMVAAKEQIVKTTEGERTIRFGAQDDADAFSHAIELRNVNAARLKPHEREAIRKRIDERYAELSEKYEMRDLAKVEKLLTGYHDQVIKNAASQMAHQIGTPITLDAYEKAYARKTRDEKLDTLIDETGHDLISALKGTVNRIGGQTAENAGEWDWYNQIKKAAKSSSLKQAEANKAADRGEVEDAKALLRWLQLNVVDEENGMTIDDAESHLSAENGDYARYTGTQGELGVAILDAIRAREAARENRRKDPNSPENQERIAKEEAAQKASFDSFIRNVPENEFSRVSSADVIANAEVGDKLSINGAEFKIIDMDPAVGEVWIHNDEFGTREYPKAGTYLDPLEPEQQTAQTETQPDYVPDAEEQPDFAEEAGLPHPDDMPFAKSPQKKPTNKESKPKPEKNRPKFTETTHVMPDGYRLTKEGLQTINAKSPILAHHGTPHKVDKFTTDKIGSGEGAQVYGWGLYFAENKDIAESYRRNLSFPALRVGENEFGKRGGKEAFVKWALDSYTKDWPHSAKNYFETAMDRFFYDVTSFETPQQAAKSAITYLTELFKRHEVSQEKIDEAAQAVQAIADDSANSDYEMQQEGRWIARPAKGFDPRRRAVAMDYDLDTKAYWDISGRIGWYRAGYEGGKEKLINEYKSTIDAQSDEYDRLLKQGDRPESVKVVADRLKLVQAALDLIESGKVSLLPVKPRGNLYTVNLLGDEDNFMEWNTEIGKQSAYIQNAFKKWLSNDPEAWNAVKSQTASQWYGGQYTDPIKAKQRSQFLNDTLGIPGIKYLDASSRQANGEPSYNFVIFDDKLVKILQENGRPVEEDMPAAKSPTVTPAQDAEYARAVESGDVAKQQAMVDAAAKRAGYNEGPVWHGTNGDFDTFDLTKSSTNTGDHGPWASGFYFANQKKVAERYGKRIIPAYLSLKNPAVITDAFALGVEDTPDGFWKEHEKNTRVILKRMFDARGVPSAFIDDMPIDETFIGAFIDAATKAGFRPMTGEEAAQRATTILQQAGYDGIIAKSVYTKGEEAKTEIVVFKPSQIKSADPITRDSQGNVIPLSKRFNPKESSIIAAKSPSILRDQILAENKPADKLVGTKAWLTPDAKWINVDEHYEIAPAGFYATPEGFGRDLVGEVKNAGFARVTLTYPWSSSSKQRLFSEHTSLNPAQRRELKDTAIEKGVELVENDNSLYAKSPQPLIEPGFYSNLRKVVDEKMPARSDRATLTNIVNAQNVKREEVKWTGILPWIAEQSEPISKESVLNYLDTEGAVRFKETRLGANDARFTVVPNANGITWDVIDPYGNTSMFGVETQELAQEHADGMQIGFDRVGAGSAATTAKFANYQEPGGENYRELVVSMPEGDAAKLAVLESQFEAAAKGIPTREWERINDQIDNPNATDPTAIRVNKARAELAGEISKLRVKIGRNPPYTSSHFPDVPNYVAHARLNDRVLPSTGYQVRNTKSGLTGPVLATRAEAEAYQSRLPKHYSTEIVEVPNEQKGTFIEELQSDRNQAGRKKGYTSDLPPGWSIIEIKDGPVRFGTGDYLELRNSEGEESGISPLHDREGLIRRANLRERPSAVADAPFRKSEAWGMHLFKRALRDAVKAKHQWIGWTKGATQVDRYTQALRQNVDRITWIEVPTAEPLTPEEVAELEKLDRITSNGTSTIKILNRYHELREKARISQNPGSKLVRAEKNGQVTFSGHIDQDGTFQDDPGSGMKLDEVLGKEVADKVKNDVAGDLRGDGLTVGGKGMLGFYDDIMVKEVGKYVKQWGSKVETAEIQTRQPSRSMPDHDENGNSTLTTPIWKVEITPAMERGLEEGQAIFAKSPKGQIDVFAGQNLGQKPKPAAEAAPKPKKVDSMTPAEKWEPIPMDKRIGSPLTEPLAELARKYLHIIPGFQGQKKVMAGHAAAIIQQWSQSGRDKITRIVDYFGGGGMWGGYLGLTHFRNVKDLTIYEYAPMRALKIKLQQAGTDPQKLLHDPRMQRLIREATAAVEAKGTFSGSPWKNEIAKRIDLLEKDPQLEGFAAAMMDFAHSSIAAGKNAELKAAFIIRRTIEDLKGAHEGHEELRKRGINVTIQQADSYAMEPIPGEHVLAVADPPYYLTTGYNGKGDVPIGIYQKTRDLIKAHSAAGNSIIYTDSAWWIDSPEDAQHTGELGNPDIRPADQIAREQIVDSLQRVAVVVPQNVDRHEVLGIKLPGNPINPAAWNARGSIDSLSGNDSGERRDETKPQRGVPDAHKASAGLAGGNQAGTSPSTGREQGSAGQRSGNGTGTADATGTGTSLRERLAAAIADGEHLSNPAAPVFHETPAAEAVTKAIIDSGTPSTLMTGAAIANLLRAAEAAHAAGKLGAWTTSTTNLMRGQAANPPRTTPAPAPAPAQPTAASQNTPTPQNAPESPETALENTRAALASMQPLWRDVLLDSQSGLNVEQVAAKRGLTPIQATNILRMAEGRLRALLKAGTGDLRPAVRVSAGDAGLMQYASGRPELAFSANPNFNAVDASMDPPERIQHAEMNDLASAMFDAHPEDAEKWTTMWLDSGGTNVSTTGMSPEFRKIVDVAQARNAVHMLATAAAKLFVTQQQLRGGDAIQAARLIHSYRHTGTEIARALSMRYDPHLSPEERSAMFVSESLLTPPDAMLQDIRKNPENKNKILAAWAASADHIKETLKAQGYDIDATFASLAEEQKLERATVPDAVRPELGRSDRQTRIIVKSILRGETPAQAASLAGVDLPKAKELYTAFRDKVNQAGVAAARQAKEQMLAAASPQFANGLPDPSIFDQANSPGINTPATQALAAKKAAPVKAGTIPLGNKVAVARLINTVATAKSTAFDKLTEFWKASILSGPMTHVVNFVSSTAFGTYEATVKKAGIGVMADVARMFGMKPDAASLADMPAMLSAALPAIKEGFRHAIESWNAERRFFDDFARNVHQQPALNGFKTEAFAPAMKGPVGTLMRSISFRAMTAADEFVKSFFTRIEVAAQARQIARTEGLKGQAMANRIGELMQPGSRAWIRALDHADTVTFQEHIGAGNRAIDTIDGMAKLIKRAKKGDAGKAAKAVSHFIFPFIDTPTNIFKTGITMSPLGSVLALVDAARSLDQRRRGNKEEAERIYNAARALNDIANQIVAWGSIYALSSLIKPGDDDDKLPHLTGSQEYRANNKGERELGYRTAPPLSIRIGDTWYSYARLDPFASALAVTVDAIKAFQSDTPTDQAFARVGAQMVRNMEDKTFLQGISDLMNAINNPERFGTQWATNIATGFIPNLIRQPIRAGDAYVRDTAVAKNVGFWDALGKRIGWSVVPESAPIKVDVWGNQASKNTGTAGPQTDFLMRLLSLVTTKDGTSPDPLDVALFRYNQKHPDEGRFSVTAPSRDITRTINGKEIKVTLDDQQYNDFITKAGQTARAAIGSTYNNRNLDDKDVDHIKDIITKAQGLHREIAFRRAYKP